MLFGGPAPSSPNNKNMTRRSSFRRWWAEEGQRASLILGTCIGRRLEKAEMRGISSFLLGSYKARTLRVLTSLNPYQII